MKISIPTLPAALLSRPSLPAVTHPVAVARVAEFLNEGNILVVTGAGVSVDSGIRAYRGKSGHYTNPNYKPIYYHELVDHTALGHSFRQRYWSRSYLGYPPVRDALPNPTHYALAALQLTGHVPRMITQNVDGLHHKATPPEAENGARDKILELHGTLHTVHCRKGHKIDRMAFQDRLSALNPAWKAFMDEMIRTKTEPRTNPDGDVDIRGVDFSNFVLPVCETCEAQGIHDDILKPAVIFFGESISTEVKQRSFDDVEASDRVMFIGTTLATYSAFRLLKHAVELNKPTMLLNIGPTRADDVPGVDKLEASSSNVLRDALRALMTTSALKGENVEVVERLLNSGIVKPPPEDGEDRAPRAAG